MVFVFGNKNYGEQLGYVVTKCRKCNADRVFSVHQERQKLTLYFVPTVQYRVKQYMTCTRCTQRSEIADALKPEIAKRLMTKDQVEQMLGELAAETRLPAPRCPGCTGTVEPGMRFCPNCGGKLA